AGGAVHNRIGRELPGDQDRLVGLRAAAQPSGQRGPRDPDLPGFGRVGSRMTAGPRRRSCRGHCPAPFGRIYVSQPVARGLPLETGSARMPTDRRPGAAFPREDADQMPNDADRAGTPAGVFGAELRFYRTRAGLSQKDLAARANVSHDVISKIETGERPPAEDFPPRLDAVPELDTRGTLTRLWDHLKKGQKQRLYGWF